MAKNIQAGISNTDRKRLLRKFKKMGQNVAAVADEAAYNAAVLIRDAARSRAPGPYIFAAVEEKTRSSVTVSIGPDRKHWYYSFSEYGVPPHVVGPKIKKAVKFAGIFSKGDREHPGIPARPFLGPAVDSQRQAALEGIWDEFWGAITDVARSG